MAWSYEIRDSRNCVLEQRSGFRTEKQARNAGRCMKRMIDCFCFPNLEPLTVITRNSAGARRTKLPNPALKYSWQQLVLDAFMEPNPRTIPEKINVAERAISARLTHSEPCDLDEHIALREALLALRRLLHQFVRDEQQLSRTKKRA